MTSVELATKVGVSKTMVSYWISGKNFPSPENIQAIAAALGVPIWQLFVSPDEVQPVSGGARATCPHCGKPVSVEVNLK